MSVLRTTELPFYQGISVIVVGNNLTLPSCLDSLDSSHRSPPQACHICSD